MNQLLPPSDVPEPTGYSEAGPPAAAQPQAITTRFAANKPTVTYTLLGVTVFVFLLQYVSQWTYQGADAAAILGMKVNTLIQSGQFWRLITPVFLHANLMHLGFNMYALYTFGPGLERVYGHGRFFTLYFLAGFSGNVLSFLLSGANSLGASTAIFGLLGAEAVFLYQNRTILHAAQRMLANLIIVGLINLMIGLAPGSNIDNWGHLGGLLGGALFAWFGGPVLIVEDRYPERVVVDGRQPGEVIRAGLGVFAVFGLLALMGILFF